MGCIVKFVGKDLRLVTKGIEDKADAIVRSTAFEVEGKAKQNAPVDTGALKSSIYAVTSKGTDYQKAVAEAKAKMAKRGLKQINAKILSRSGRLRKCEAWVIVAVAYGLDVELHHQGRKERLKTYKNKSGKRVVRRRRNIDTGLIENVIEPSTTSKAGFMKRALESARANYRERLRDALR